MKVAATFIKHNVMTILLYLMVIVFGFYSFSTLPLALMPSMEVPAAIVYATYPGAGPEDIEQQVAKPLESAVAGLSGLDTLQSTSSENMAMLIVQFTDSTDLDDAMTDLRDKVSQVKSQLPDDASDPTVMSIDIDSMPVVQVALRGSDLAALQSIAEDEISPALERLDGVASVDVSGGYEDEVAVKTNAARLKGYNLTITSVAQQLGADNMAIPGGDLDNGSQTLAVRTDGEYSSLNDVKNALISLPAGGTVRLSQIADVSMQPKDRSTIAKVDGEECIMLSVNKQSGSNTVKVAQSAVDRLNEVIAENDALQADVVMDQSDYINMTVDNAVQNIWMGVLFAAVVLLVFLRDLGATLSLTIAMPCCILFTFLIMNVCGITLNMMSLGGITLGVGMIVDNSIVVLENIFSYRADGYSRWDACTKGTGEVMTSVTASTLTTIAVFLPIALSGGMTGMMFREFCITIVALLLSSLIIALTLVPLLCYFLLGCAAIAVCEFCSGLTENQIIAAVMGFSALLLAYMMPSLRSMFNAGSAVALVVFTALSAGASLAVGLRTRSFTLGCFCFAALCAGLSALFLLRSAWLTEAFSAVLSALCLFAPFEEFVNNSFSIQTLVYYLTVPVLFLFFTAQGIEKRRWN